MEIRIDFLRIIPVNPKCTLNNILVRESRVLKSQIPRFVFNWAIFCITEKRDILAKESVCLTNFRLTIFTIVPYYLQLPISRSYSSNLELSIAITFYHLTFSYTLTLLHQQHTWDFVMHVSRSLTRFWAKFARFESVLTSTKLEGKQFTSSSQSFECSNTNEQLQSTFFLKLSIDIRTLIYKALVADIGDSIPAANFYNVIIEL